MNFSAPWMLWSLLAAIPLAAVYFLKVRPRRRQVTAFFLWQKLLREKKASSLFQRLRDAVSLILLLAVLIMAVLAASGLRWTGADPRDMLVIVDVTASMNSTYKGKPLHAQSQETVRDIIRSLNGSRRMAIASASDELRFVSHLSDNPRDLTAAATNLTSCQLPISKSTINAINAYAKKNHADAKSGHRVILITDGHSGWDGLSNDVEVLRIGAGRLDNTGIVAADLQWLGISGKRAAFFYQVTSSWEQSRNVDLELRHLDSNTAYRLIPLTIPAKGEISATVELEDLPDGKWQARLITNDALSLDNTVPMGLPPRDPVTLQAPKEDAYFFTRCVEAFERASGTLALVSSGASVAIARGSVPEGKQDFLLFAPKGESPYWTGGTDAADVSLAEATMKDHPLLKNFLCENIPFAGAKKCQPVAGSLILAKSDLGDPLLWLSNITGRRGVVVNLDPIEAEFFLSPWFPVIVHNAATHLTGKEGESRSVRPTGTADSRPEIGHWQDQRGSWTASALLSKNESLLLANGPAASAQNIDRGHPLPQFLLLAAILVVAAESFLYHRRKVG